MATNYLKWIKYFFVFLLAIALPFSIFTSRVFAADTLYSTTSNGRDVLEDISLPYYASGTNTSYSSFLTVGKASIDSIFLADITFDVSCVKYDTGIVLTISYKPMTATYDSQQAVYPISSFDGVTVSFNLPRRITYGGEYSSDTELVTLTIGGSYGEFSDLFLTSTNYQGLVINNWTSTDNTYHHFRIDTRYIGFDGYNSFIGSYTNYSGTDLILYFCQTLENCVGYTDTISVRTSFAYDIDYFPNALSYADREQLLKLDQISGDLDELLSAGDGQFDNMHDQMQDTSDKADQANQDIQNNAPKPDINDTVNDTSDVIDEALSGEAFDKLSDLLSAIFANTLISTILLISVAVGAVKYIFFGKG